jgi:putative spermidine/putrescine transport system ATP-binding protein
MYGGVIEQMGTPSEMYTTPQTPFVAEFIGTMNRLEATVVEASSGAVRHGETQLDLAAARGRKAGERVLVLVRPEVLQLEASSNGAGAPNTLTGTVLSQTFLGAVTRVKVTTDAATLISDMSAARAEALPVGARVTARFPSDEARLISLPEDGPELSELAALAVEDL